MKITEKVSFWTKVNLSRGVLPENLRRGPYAVVDELVLDLTDYCSTRVQKEVKSVGFY